MPSGRLGKSTNPKSYEAQYNYGHEEWLFDKARVVEGFRYAFLEPLRVESGKHIGKTFNISLFTMNSNGGKFDVGSINKVFCITDDEAARIFHIYKKNGWIREMAEEGEKNRRKF